MRRVLLTAACVALAALQFLPAPDAEDGVRAALRRGSGVIQLPPGVLTLRSELVVPAGAHDLTIRGASSGTLLRAGDRFRGRAVLRLESGVRIRLEGFAIHGNRAILERPAELPPSNVSFARFYSNNGLLAEGVETLTVANLRFVEVANFPILVSRCRGVRIEDVSIADSGSRNAAGRNNASGGILLEEGTADFSVANCTLRRIRGNGVWTHSLYTSPRNRNGLVAGNTFEDMGRDAIQIGHATGVRVERNSGRRIGFPVSEVEPQATPVAIDTAGNTDHTVYASNHFEDIDGKCIDLDGFHHGEVLDNVCLNFQPREHYPYGHFGIVMNNTNPDMLSERIVLTGNRIEGAVYGGIFVLGSGHRIAGNRLLRLNLARCGTQPGCLYWPDEPDLLRSGIYLGRKAERPATTTDNIIVNNDIQGFGQTVHCIAAAPGVALRDNRVGPNRCRE